MMTRGISSVGTKVRNIGRGVSENQEKFGGMIGINLARANLGALAGVGVGGIGGATLLTRYSGWLKDNDGGTGTVDHTSGGGRFSSLKSNIGYNQIVGLNKK